MFEPMAIAILFGLVFSTALTLGVVPRTVRHPVRRPVQGLTWNERPTPQVQPAGTSGALKRADRPDGIGRTQPA